MANVVSAAVTPDALAQADGRMWFYQLFTLSDGTTWKDVYLAAVGHDADAALIVKQAIVEALLTQREIAENLASFVTLGSLAPAASLKFSTVSQNGAAARQHYLTSSKLDSVLLGDYLSTLPNGVLQTAFGMTAGQVTTLRTNKLTPAANLAASIRATVGQ